MMRAFSPKGAAVICLWAFIFLLFRAHPAASKTGAGEPYCGFPGRFRGAFLKGEGFTVQADYFMPDFGMVPGGGSGFLGFRAGGIVVSLSGDFDLSSLTREGGRRGDFKFLPDARIEGARVVFDLPPAAFFGGGLSFSSLEMVSEEGRVFLSVKDLSLGGFSAPSFEAEFFKDADDVVFPRLAGEFAGGEFSASGRFLSSEGVIKVSGSIDDVFIDELVRIDGYDVSGTGSVLFDLAGDPMDVSSFSGSISAKIKDADICGLPVVYGLAPIVLRPSGRDLIFSEGRADFTLEEGFLNTGNARLVSEHMSFAGSGSFGLDGSVDLLVSTLYTEEFMKQRPALLEVFSHFLKIFDFFIIQHRLTGTVLDPVYEPYPVPLISRLPHSLKRVLGFLLPPAER